jgi:hypothetical protein
VNSPADCYTHNPSSQECALAGQAEHAGPIWYTLLLPPTMLPLGPYRHLKYFQKKPSDSKNPVYPQPTVYESAHTIWVYVSAAPGLVKRNRNRKSEILLIMNCIQDMIKIQFVYQINTISTFRLILCRKIICIYCEGHTRHVSAHCGQILIV